jgi:hypothetical protein
MGLNPSSAIYYLCGFPQGVSLSVPQFFPLLSEEGSSVHFMGCLKDHVREYL